MFNGFRRIVLNGFPVCFQPFRMLLHILEIVELLFDKNMTEGINQRHVATVFQLQMLVSNTGGFNTTWVADNDFCAVLASFNYPAGYDWVRVGAVITKDQQAF